MPTKETKHLDHKKKILLFLILSLKVKFQMFYEKLCNAVLQLRYTQVWLQNPKMKLKDLHPCLTLPGSVGAICAYKGIPDL